MRLQSDVGRPNASRVESRPPRLMRPQFDGTRHQLDIIKIDPSLYGIKSVTPRLESEVTMAPSQQITVTHNKQD